ncbi:hypothetical protein DM01DRAFT_1411669 [Hesseltinella vesiculosa]|uniref:Uncharacterized protein n=1 Tax=Hesseltinella vesiculosa TaxID=101127 RepID=A0A1X2G2R2_9FUNG|nr:hypothetical protein DM01DRAFT_1411669 [Hesseltinella vesiculosa]
MDAAFSEYFDSNQTKPSLSGFVNGYLSAIENVEFNSDCLNFKTVKSTVIQAFNDFCSKRGVTDAVIDKHYVDWDSLTKHLNELYQRRHVVDDVQVIRSQVIEELSVGKALPSVPTPPPSLPFLDSGIIRNMRKQLRSAKKDKSLSDMDLTKHGIFDMVSYPNKGTVTILGEHMRLWCQILKHNSLEPCDEALDARKFAKLVLITLYTVKNNTPKLLKEIIKASKDISTSTVEKVTRKILKVYCNQFRANGTNRLEMERSEGDYGASFVYPLFFHLFEDTSFDLLWGEVKLIASKQYDDVSLCDEDRRSSGANVDGKVMSSCGFEICVIEISRAPAVADYNHYLGDRFKIALNLKKMLKAIVKKHPFADKSLIPNIKMIGIQLYRHQMSVYCLSMPVWGIYAFELVKIITLPTNIDHCAIPASQLAYMLFVVKDILTKTQDAMEKFATDYDSLSDEDNSVTESNEPSPKTKRQKTWTM